MAVAPAAAGEGGSNKSLSWILSLCLRPLTGFVFSEEGVNRTHQRRRFAKPAARVKVPGELRGNPRQSSFERERDRAFI